MTVPSYLMALGVAAGVSLFGSHAAFAESKDTTTTTNKPEIVKVQSGDTLSSIAEAHGTDYVRLFNANDFITNPDIIDVDQQVRIPKADEQLPDRFSQFQVTAVAAPAPAPASATTTTYQAPAAPVYSQSSAGNTYAYGWCTWYVKSRKPNIPNTWGNAYSWVGSAQTSGYATGSAPVAGAIGAAGNHVIYVESVNGDMVNISEMAYAGGVGVVHYRTVPASSFLYIYA